ncbi:MAG: hypothetical protein V4819_11460 [Verrucomicrobiota bacterium]
MFRLAASSLFLALCLIGRAAPEAPAVPANQLVVAGNACGPTALLNAFRFGNPAWQRASNAIAGDTDKQRISNIIREGGMRPSSHLVGHPRWSRKGVNLADLCDIANEMTRGHFLPQVSQEVLFLKPGETQEKLLKRVHQRLATSIAKGLPPVISLRRYAKRGRGGKPPEWIVLEAHFVTLTALPPKLEKGAGSFPISYIDPWGGKTCQGVISLPGHPILADSVAASPCLEAVFPQALVGKKSIRPGEPNGLIIAAMLGRW